MRGEEFAAKLLTRMGYRILERNFRSRFGEIDLVALKDKTLVFVEVKTRFSQRYGNPFESVTPWKLRKITKTAQYYSLLHPDLPQKLLIQVVGLEIANGRVINSQIVSVC